jgi:chemotaxis protein MotB
MFELGSSVVQPYMRDILRAIGDVLNEVDGRVALSGHTDAAPYAGGERGYSNWELSADRANASRRELVAGGLGRDRIVRVVGLADSSLLMKDDPRSPLNRRIAIILLNKLAEDRLNKANGEIEAGTADELEQSLPDAAAAATAATPGAPAAGTVKAPL